MDLKEKIKNVAAELFSEVGYEATTVSQIINNLNISRGGFYHHFSSKEEILEEISIGYVKELKAYLDNLYSNSNEGIVGIMNAVFTTINEMKVKKIEDWQGVHKMYAFKGNHKIIIKMAYEFERVVADFYTQLIVDGNELGIFNARYPKALGDLWTRELLKIYKVANQIVVSKDKGMMKDYEALLEFTESIINYSLDGSKGNIQIKTAGLEFLNEMCMVYQGK